MKSRNQIASCSIAVLATCLLALASPLAAQTPAAPATGSARPAAPDLNPNEQLVARIALYPDDLVAIVLPAATKPLDIVEAERFLEKRKQDPKLQVPTDWDNAVKSLVNYPVIITSMSQDLDWTKALGDAVIVDQAMMLEAVQSYRRKVNAVGNLKSDEKQIIVVEKEIIKIVQANPEIIYVPQYNSSSVIVYGGYSSWGYYGAPYPVYYYPYPPGAVLATGIIWGAALGSMWNGGHYVSHYDGVNNIRINNGDINIGSGNRGQGNLGQGGLSQGNRGNVATSDVKRGAGAGDRSWSPGAAQAGPKVGNRIGDPQAGNRANGLAMGPQLSDRAGSASAFGPPASNRASAGTMGPQLGNSSAGNRSRDFSGLSASANRYGGSGASAFGGYGSRNSAGMSSSRGSMSRGGGMRRR